jgi:hypothetical protein
MMQNEWQPIETAPRDRTPMLVWPHLGLPVVAYRTVDGWCYTLPGKYETYPSHWQPLPPLPDPPSSASGEK